MQSGWLEEGGGGGGRGHWSFKLIAALFQISVTGVNSISLLTKTLSPTVFSNCSCLVISNKADLSSVWTRPTSKKYSFWDYLSIVSPLIEFGCDRGEEEKKLNAKFVHTVETLVGYEEIYRIAEKCITS